MNKWITTIVASLFFSYQFMQLNLMSVIGDPISQQYQLTQTQLGWVSSVYLLALAAVYIPVGILFDRFKIKNLMMSAVILSYLSLFAIANIQFFWLLVLMRIVSGMTQAVAFLGCMRVIQQLHGENTEFPVGILLTIGLLGGVMVNLPLVLLMQLVGWKVALNLLGVLGIVIAILMFFLIHVDDSPLTRESKSDSMTSIMQELWHKPLIICAALYICLMNSPMMILGAAWGIKYFTVTTHFSTNQIASLISILFLGSIVGSPAMGWLGHRIKQYHLIMKACALISIMIALALMFYASVSFALTSGLLFLLGLFTSAQILGYPIIMSLTNPQYASLTMGVASVVITVGGSLMLPLFGSLMRYAIIYHHSLNNSAFIVLPLMLLISVALASFVKKSK